MALTLDRRAFLERVFGAAVALRLGSACRGHERAIEEIPGALYGQDAQSGHLLRGDRTDRIAHVRALAPSKVSVAIVGGGPAGLSAAYALARAEEQDFVLLELESVLGGTARGERSAVTAYPWGAHYLPVPQTHNRPLIALLREMGVVGGERADGTLEVSEPHLVRTPEERVFYRGYWYPGIYLEAGASAQDLDERARFLALVAHWVGYRDARGRRAFTVPTRMSSDAPELRALDRITGKAWLAQQGLASPRLHWWLDYACRDDYGLTLEQTSAWALLFYFAARCERPGDEPSDLITWPQGNFALVEHLAKSSLRQARARTLVLDVEQSADRVHVFAWDLAQDRGLHVLADHAILATPRFVTNRIARDQAPSLASYAPWLVANVHLAERPRERSVPLAWDNVLYESHSLGYVCATHQRGSDYGPTVLTYYLPFCDADPKRARQKLFDGDLPSWRQAVLLDLLRAHPDLTPHVTRLDVFRWGHAMVRPEVGSIWSDARLAAQRPQGRVHFAHSDLSGVSLFEEAFDHGVRAAQEVLNHLGRVSVL